MVTQNQDECTTKALLAELASLWGVSTTYQDAGGRACASPAESVFEVLVALAGESAPEIGPAGCGYRPSSARARSWLEEAIQSRQAQQRGRLVAPVLVAWEGMLSCDVPDGGKATLFTEDGLQQQIGSGPQNCAFGYHRLRVEYGTQADEATVISAPLRCWGQDDGVGRWGVFAPAYALRSRRDWGSGDLAEVDALRRVVSDAGGRTVATLPLLAAYLDRPFEPSPYSPVSRLFWNEFYLAMEYLPEWSECHQARAIWESRSVQEMVAAVRARDAVDHAEVMALKRKVLAELCDHFFRKAGSQRRDDLTAYVRERPEALAYADFRARVEDHGCDWRYWPADSRCMPRVVTDVDGLPESGRYHLYVQWQMERQLESLFGRDPSGHASCGEGRPGRDVGAGLFLDLPVGVHPGGFDVWQRQDIFVGGMSAGAPPDGFFSAGQCWNSPPLHPETIRIDGHSHWRQVLRNHMRLASHLRLDHVMSLHRLFWIPEGREPREGVYVDYPTEELYAVLCLESQRNRTAVTGEDLGTVPSGVRSRMRRHGVSRTWVLQAALHPRSSRIVGAVPRGAVATLGTHDMFPLAGYLEGDDVAERVRTGRLGQSQGRRALAARRRVVSQLVSFLTKDSDASDTSSLLAAALVYLRSSEAALVLVDLSDLLRLRRPHNVPGTGRENANWCRKFEADEEGIRRAVLWAAELMR